DLGVGPAAGDEGENLRLAFGQALEPQGGPAAGGGTLLGEVRDEAARHGGGEEGVARGHHPYGGDEVGGRCVLQQEAARARPQRLVHVVVDVERGEHQDPRPVLPRRPGGAGGAAGGEQPAGGLQPVHLGHPHVHQHHVGPGAAAQLDAPGAVGGLAHHVDVALGGQQGGETGPHHGLVVDDDDARRHVKSFPARGSRAATRKPPSGRGPTSRVPPTSRTRSRMPTSPCPVPPVSRGPPGGRGGGPLTTRTVRRSSPGPPSGSGSGSGTDRDTRVVAPGACRTTLARASWTIRYAESPTASGTSCSQGLNSTGPPALAVAST